MNTNKPVVCWPLIAGYLGIMIALVACGVSGVNTATSVPTAESLLRLEDGAVKVQDKNKAWVPVGGKTTFELVGELENTNPWKVTGNTFATRDSTQIGEGLEVGELVRVKGIILEDGTWLATSIEPAEKQVDSTLTLIGKVNSIDPWLVNGLKLNVTSDTVITGKIVPNMIVRVEILLLNDGTWEVVSITPLSNFTEIPGCATVFTKVENVDGNEVQFTGWPVVKLDEDVKIENDGGGAGKLAAGQSVLVVVCAPENGQVMITHIIILTSKDEDTSPNAGKVVICHKPDKKGGHTLSVSSDAVPAHLAHGDKLGACL